jgi:hypothetical protein
MVTIAVYPRWRPSLYGYITTDVFTPAGDRTCVDTLRQTRTHTHAHAHARARRVIADTSYDSHCYSRAGDQAGVGIS